MVGSLGSLQQPVSVRSQEPLATGQNVQRPELANAHLAFGVGSDPRVQAFPYWKASDASMPISQPNLCSKHHVKVPKPLITKENLRRADQLGAL